MHRAALRATAGAAAAGQVELALGYGLLGFAQRQAGDLVLTAAGAGHVDIAVDVILILLGCAGFGGYGTFGAGSQNGLFEVISNSAGRPAASERYIPGGPEPIRTRYTGVVAIDDHVIVLVAFFTFLIDGPQTWDITLSYWYLMAHFCAGWTLMALEGLRKGNRGKLVSWYASDRRLPFLRMHAAHKQ
jgi:hypothetical protein